MFKRIEEETQKEKRKVTFFWNGHSVTGEEGDTVAAALLAAGVRATRTHPETNEPRAPFCMMGTCFECLVEIDGVENRQACQIRLKDGMQVSAQKGPRK